MPRKQTPSFIVELPLETSSDDERRLTDRFKCGARITNVMIQHARDTVTALRDDSRWIAARKLPKAEKEKAYANLRTEYGFTSSAFDARVAEHAKAAGFVGRIGSHELQMIAKQVFNSANQWLFGIRGKPRFKGYRRPVHSLSGKNNTGMLQWKADKRVLQIEKGWQLNVVLPDLAKDEWLWSALEAPTKYCRVVWRNVRGERRWYVQLVQEGHTPLKASLLEKLASPDSVGGLDLGPSTLAWCTETSAGVVKLAAEVDRPAQLIRRLQRKIDRQRRVANPANFKPDGTAKKGCRTWAKSANQRTVETQLANLHRQEAAIRKESHGRLVNRLLTQARHWKDDGVSPKALQKRYGKSVGTRAPGLLMSELTRKAERAGGSRTVINVWALKTSQYDHTTDDFAKKPLSQRWHLFRDGRGTVQRDVYSAFLAMQSDGNTHNPFKLETAWAEMTTMLQVAGLCERYQEANEAGEVSSPLEYGSASLPSELLPKSPSARSESRAVSVTPRGTTASGCLAVGTHLLQGVERCQR